MNYVQRPIRFWARGLWGDPKSRLGSAIFEQTIIGRSYLSICLILDSFNGGRNKLKSVLSLLLTSIWPGHFQTPWGFFYKSKIFERLMSSSQQRSPRKSMYRGVVGKENKGCCCLVGSLPAKTAQHWRQNKWHFPRLLLGQHGQEGHENRGHQKVINEIQRKIHLTTISI